MIHSRVNKTGQELTVVLDSRYSQDVGLFRNIAAEEQQSEWENSIPGEQQRKCVKVGEVLGINMRFVLWERRKVGL